MDSLLRRFAEARLSGALEEAHDASDAVYELLETTETNPGFEGPAEVWDFVERPYYYPPDKDMDRLESVDELHQAFVEMFANPLRPHFFEVPLGGAVVRGGGISIDFGGAGALRLAPRVTVHELLVSTLSGVVQAATVNGALRKVGRLTEEVAGALRALGLARFGPWFNSPKTTLPVAHITDDRATNPEGQDFALDPEFMSVQSLTLCMPADLTDLEARSIRSEETPVELALSRYTRTVATLMSSGSTRARELRNACRIAIRAETSAEYGFAIAMAFTCLESLLLGSKEGDVMAKLREAVAYSLGRTPDERQQLRKQVNKLYEIRSKFVHMGKAAQGLAARQESVQLMYKILRRELEALPAEEGSASASDGATG